MLLLITYVIIALGFSFLCSIAEAVLLSVSSPYIALLEKEGKPSGALLRKLKEDVNNPLAAILTLNTIAHTIGAAGAGAQAVVVFGNAYVGIASAVLTLLILIFSEIIPKTLGAHHWRKLAPATAYTLRVLVWILYPFVLLAEKLTRGLSHGPTLKGFSREEFAVMSELGAAEGQLHKRESKILKNLFHLRQNTVGDVMTPRTVVFALPEALCVADFFVEHVDKRFSRIPIYTQNRDHITGFVLRSDLLLAQAKNEGERALSVYCRELDALPETTSLLQAFEYFLNKRAQIMLVVDEYGATEGIVTLEDVLETLLGLEIIDESDRTADMRALARQLWQRRAKAMGVVTGNNRRTPDN